MRRYQRSTKDIPPKKLTWIAEESCGIIQTKGTKSFRNIHGTARGILTKEGEEYKVRKCEKYSISDWKQAARA